jgi:7,8-dihydroneopterin aldolase/epimerase/oxygenase
MAHPDRLMIEGLRVQTIIGVRDWERKVRQTVVIDLELETDAARAAAADALADALDYGTLSRRVSAEIANTSFQLIETLAEHVAALIQAEFGVRRIRVRIRKPGAIPNAAAVSIVIERGEAGRDA